MSHPGDRELGGGDKKLDMTGLQTDFRVTYEWEYEDLT